MMSSAVCGSPTRDNRINAVDRDPDDGSRDSVDNLIVSLQAYVTRAATRAKKKKGEEELSQPSAGPKQYPPRIPPIDGFLSSIARPEQRLTRGFGPVRFGPAGSLADTGFPANRAKCRVIRRNHGPLAASASGGIRN
jgi:hypothetical protein